MGACTDALE